MPPDSPRGPASDVTAAGRPSEMCDALNSIDEVDVRMLCQMMRGVDVSEIYSPERVAKVAEAMGLKKGLSMDILTGWDFNLNESRRRAWAHVKEDKPLSFGERKMLDTARDLLTKELSVACAVDEQVVLDELVEIFGEDDDMISFD